MSTTLFTPEPLFVFDSTKKVEDGYAGTFDIITREEYIVGVRVVGNVMPYGGEIFCTHEEARAYAKLFAAAPYMLNALRSVQKYLYYKEIGESYPHPKFEIDEAIKKATQ